MAYIKKLVMQGFKSFAKKTEIIFDKGNNVILGPNGSGKSCCYSTVLTLANGEEVKIGELVENEINGNGKINKLDDGVYVNGNNEIKFKFASNLGGTTTGFRIDNAVIAVA